MRSRGPLVLLLLLGASVAHGESLRALTVVWVPPAPSGLAMRVAAPEGVAVRPRQRAARSQNLVAAPQGERKLSDQVIFRVNLGFAMEGGSPNDMPNALLTSGVDIRDTNYRRLRVYGFGDAVLGTKGLGVPSLATYFASQFRLEKPISAQSDLGPSFPIPSVFDAEGTDSLLVRSAYGETNKLFDAPLLKPLSVRAGRQFRYGPAISHFDGISANYDTRRIELSVYSGRRVNLYGYGAQSVEYQNRGVLFGANARSNLAWLIRVPLVAAFEYMKFDGDTHLDARLGYRISAQSALTGRLRWFDARPAEQSIRLRTRLSKVTTVSSEIINRTRNDLIYDLFLARPQAAGDPRRYLDFGSNRPRTLLNVRAGTVWLDNVDLLARGAAAIARRRESEARSAHTPSYLEGGAAFEVRLRRSLRVGASALIRRLVRTESLVAPESVRDGIADPLPTDTASVGERSFSEGGFSLRYSGGSRRFSAASEVYGRIYRQVTPYTSDFLARELRSGARFSVDGWVGRALRLKIEYDLAFVSERIAPELRGLKSLRVLAEGSF